MALCTVEGLVLRTRELGEADRIVTLITREKGKLQAVARGARRVRSRLLAVAQPFAQAKYMLFLNSRSLHNISQAELLQSFRCLREELTSLAYASYLAELTDLCLPEEEPHEAVFQAIIEAFDLMEKGIVPASLVTRWYEMHILDLMGFRPELDDCVNCRLHIEPSLAGDGMGFSVVAGGVLCRQCAQSDKTAGAIGGATWQSMRYLLSVSAEKLSTFHPDESTLDQIEKLLTAYIEYRLERRLNSLAFLQSL